MMLRRLVSNCAFAFKRLLMATWIFAADFDQLLFAMQDGNRPIEDIQ